MDDSSPQAIYNKNNSNNVELIPLKDGDCLTKPFKTTTMENQLANGGRMVNSPLPAVPLPEKKWRKSTRPHASCDDIAQLTPDRRTNMTPQPQSGQLTRASSMDFDMFNRSTSITQPLLNEASPFGTNPRPRNATLRPGNCTAKYTPIHNYEELNEHERQLQVQIAQGRHLAGVDNHQYQPMASQAKVAQQSTLNVARPSFSGEDSLRQYVRERQNPMYSGVRAVSPFSAVLEDVPVTRKSSVISEKCACAVVATLVTAFIISLLSITIVILFAMGVISPLPISGSTTESQLLQLRKDVSMLKFKQKTQQEDVSETIDQFAKMVDDLRKQINLVATNKTEVRASEIRSQLTSAVQSLSPEEIQSIFGSLSGSAISRCRHEEGSIGSSTLQTETNSGEYYADPGYVITGATCSSDEVSYVGRLQAREEVADGNRRVLYKCVCVRMAPSTAPSSGRVECKIDYWQCPTSPA